MSDSRDTAMEERVRAAYRAAELPDAPEGLLARLPREPVGPAPRPSRRFGGGPASRLVPVLIVVALAGGLALIAGSGWRSPLPGPTTAPGSAGDRPSLTASTGSVAPSVAPSSPGTAGVVPWSSETPVPPTATPSPASTAVPADPECRTAQLAIGRAYLGGATGSLAGGFSIVNTGPRACVVQGVARVELIDGDGRPMPVTQEGAGSRRGPRVELAPGQEVPPLGADAPLGTATVSLQWSNWCEAPPREPVRLRVSLPGGENVGVARVPSDGLAPRCDEPTAGSALWADPFRAVTGPEPTEPPAVPASSLSGHLELPEAAVLGQPLRYVLVLTNSTSSAIRLEPCPAYRQQLGVAGRDIVQEGVLNCVGLPPIEPGASVRFEMVLRVPADLEPTDRAGVLWQLDPYYGTGFPGTPPNDKAVVRLVAP